MKSKNKRIIFVTGASGFIGANLIRELLNQNDEIHILNHTKKNSWRLEEIKNQITTHYGDLANITSLKSTLAKTQPTHIIHLATYGAYPFQIEMNKMISVNIVGTKNLLEASKDIPYKCLINTGTSSEYGFKNKPMRENDFCNPVSYYGATKLAATQICKVFAQINNKPIVTLRLFSVFGPYEEPSRFIPTIIKSLIVRNTIKLTSGSLRRDFIYAKDVVTAYMQALNLATVLQGKIINIGTRKEYTNDEVVEKLFKVTNKKTRIEKGAYPKRMWDTEHWHADISLAKEILNWNPRYSLGKGLAKNYSWFIKNLNLYN